MKLEPAVVATPQVKSSVLEQVLHSVPTKQTNGGIIEGFRSPTTKFVLNTMNNS